MLVPINNVNCDSNIYVSFFQRKLSNSVLKNRKESKEKVNPHPQMVGIQVRLEYKIFMGIFKGFWL